MDAEAAALPPAGLELAAVELHALLHPDEAVASVGAEPVARRGGPAVEDLELELALAPGHGPVARGVAGVLVRVGPAFRRVRAGRQVAARGERPAPPVEL